MRNIGLQKGLSEAMTYTTTLQYNPETHTYSVVRVEVSKDSLLEDVSKELEQLLRALEEK
jgi:hypothetical protein